MSGIEDASSKSGPDKDNKHGLRPDQFMMGATRNRDGTYDTSRALVFEDPTGKTAASFEQKAARLKAEAARDKAEREEKMRIPEEAAPGTTHRLWYEMRNVVYIQKEMLKNDRYSENQSYEHRRNNVRELETQQGLLEEIEKMKIKTIFDETPRGKTFDAGEARRSAEAMPVAEALEYLEIIDNKLMDEIDAAEKAPDSDWKAHTVENLEKKHASAGELLKKLSTAASSAQDRLRNS